MLEPCYDSYVPNIELAGGVAVRVPLTPGSFRPDFAKIAAAITPRTRAIIINSPHNPSATVWTHQEMLQLQELLAPTNVLLISDEVYEHMVFDERQHHSAASYPGLAARAFIVSSFGKTYHVTGWKVGLCGRAAGVDGRVPQGAPVQRVHRQHTGAARAGRLHGRPQAPTWTCRPSTSASATCSARPAAKDPLQAAAQRGQLLPVRGYLGRE